MDVNNNNNSNNNFNNNNFNLNNNNNINLENLNTINTNNNNKNNNKNTTNNKSKNNNNKNVNKSNSNKNISNKSNNKSKSNNSNGILNYIGLGKKKESNNKEINKNNKSELRFDKVLGENAFLLIVLISALLIAAYIAYYYYTPTTSLKSGYTYYGKDIANYEPLFQLYTENVNDCIDRCERDRLCTGFTFNKNTNECSGTANGKLRIDDNNFMAWEKPEQTLDIYFKKTLIKGMIDKEIVILNQVIPRPELENRFVISFWLNIKDWYSNFEYWKHILHKGNSVDSMIIYKDWEDLIVDYPEQYPGFWLAPFTNNLRICITTMVEIYTNNKETEYKHAHMLFCNNGNCIQTDKTPIADKNKMDSRNIKYIKQIEYYDIRNIPINRLFQISIVLYKKTMEIYFDGKIKQIVKLRGDPQYNNENIYAKFNKSFDGEIYNLNYVPVEGKINNIKSLYNVKPVLKK